jgi:hypothetical protein
MSLGFCSVFLMPQVAYSSLIEILGSDEPQIVLEAARALASLTASPPLDKHMTIELSGVNPFALLSLY